MNKLIRAVAVIKGALIGVEEHCILVKQLHDNTEQLHDGEVWNALRDQQKNSNS